METQVQKLAEDLAPLIEMHPFIQERLNDLEVDFRRYEADRGEEFFAAFEKRILKLEDASELSIEGVDKRLSKLQRDFAEHEEGAITLKKVRLVVEDAIDLQQEQLKRIRKIVNEADEKADRAQAWRGDIEQKVSEVESSIAEQVSKANLSAQTQLMQMIGGELGIESDKIVEKAEISLTKKFSTQIEAAIKSVMD